MKNNFIAGSANISEMDDEAKKFPIVAKTETEVTLNTVMSNSFGFGGTNAALILKRFSYEFNEGQKRIDHGCC